jgi:hypothetical protein
MVHLVQTVHLSCVEINTISQRTKTSFHLTQVTRSTIGCAQNDFQAMVHLAQTMHLSCTEINNISKQTITSFHLTHITKEYHRVCPK